MNNFDNEEFLVHCNLAGCILVCDDDDDDDDDDDR